MKPEITIGIAIAWSVWVGVPLTVWATKWWIR